MTNKKIETHADLYRAVRELYPNFDDKTHFSISNYMIYFHKILTGSILKFKLVIKETEDMNLNKIYNIIKAIKETEND